METVTLISLGILFLLTISLLVIGQNRHWGLAPVGLLGLGFVVPFLMMLVGAL